MSQHILGPSGRPTVFLTANLAAGTLVRVEVDGNGRVGVDPPSRGDAV